MLELTARHADAWNLAWFGLPDERLARVRGELWTRVRARRARPGDPDITVGVTVRYPDRRPMTSPPPNAGADRDADEIAAGLAGACGGRRGHVIAASTVHARRPSRRSPRRSSAFRGR